MGAPSLREAIRREWEINIIHEEKQPTTGHAVHITTAPYPILLSFGIWHTVFTGPLMSGTAICPALPIGLGEEAMCFTASFIYSSDSLKPDILVY